MGLRDIGETLPPGFRFYPSDEELVCHYLYKKIANEQLLRGTLVEIDLHVCEPWQLPDVAKLNSNEWYFFSFRDRKYATGYRTNRATTSGYWKATGKDRVVLDPRTRAVVGMRKTLVFYKNRAPNGIKTGWIMHEFRLENPHVPPKEDWVLCRVFHKSRGGENSGRLLSPDDFLDSTPVVAASTYPSFAANSPQNYHNQNDNNTPQCGYQNNTIPSFSHHHQGQNPSISLSLSSPIRQPGYAPLSMADDQPQLPSHLSSNHHGKCDQDDYGFIFDFGLSNGMPDDMGFNDDSSSVFI